MRARRAAWGAPTLDTSRLPPPRTVSSASERAGPPPPANNPSRTESHSAQDAQGHRRPPVAMAAAGEGQCGVTGV